MSVFFKCFIPFSWFSNFHKQHKFTNESINICVSSLNFFFFWKFLSVDVVLELKKFCPHWGSNSQPRGQHYDVLSWVLYHSAIQAPLVPWVFTPNPVHYIIATVLSKIVVIKVYFLNPDFIPFQAVEEEPWDVWLRRWRYFCPGGSEPLPGAAQSPSWPSCRTLRSVPETECTPTIKLHNIYINERTNCDCCTIISRL